MAENHGTILTFAAKQGEKKPELEQSSFAERLGQYLTKFLHDGQGNFELKSFILGIPAQLANS